jgi:hypothetical protein
MSLVHGYSSGEDEEAVPHAVDAFGLSSLPIKKMRVGDATTTVAAEAAPAVLSEVSLH